MLAWGNFFSSKSGHVKYQIEGTEVYTNMQAKTPTLRTPLTSAVRSKGQILKCADKYILLN